MFVDFDKVFNNTNKSKLIIPPALVEYLSSELPEGVKYEIDENGVCSVVSENDSTTFGGFTFVLSEDDKMVLGEDYSLNDLFSYMYNSQKKIRLKPDKPGFIIINGEEVPVEKLSYNPYKPIKYIKSTFFAIPPRFPRAFKISVGGNGCETSLSVKRVPNNSINVAKYESSKDKPIRIMYTIDETVDSVSFNVTVDIKHAKSVSELLCSMKIFNAFVDGKGELSGHKLDGKLNVSNKKKFDKKMLDFWTKVFTIEQVLGKSFVLPYEDIPYKTVCEVEHIYQNLVKKNPIKDNHTINSINSEIENVDIETERIKSAVGNLLLLQFAGTYDVDLFGIDISLPCIVFVFNAKLTDYTIENEKVKLILSDKSIEEPMYSSTLSFESEDKLKAFKKKNVVNNQLNEKMLNKFQNAELIYNYVK